MDDREIHGTIIDQLDGAMSWFRERLETEYVITGKPEREVHWEYPLEAIREAVTNSEEQLKKMELSIRQIKGVTYAKEHGSISNSEYQRVAEVSQRTATRDLNLLKSKGIFISEGSTGRGTLYRLKTP